MQTPFLLFILLIIVLVIGICSGWFLHTITNPPVESVESIASFNSTGCRFDTSTTKPFGPGKYIRFVFTPTLSGKDYSYTVITENEYNIQNTYTPTEENGIFETDILFHMVPLLLSPSNAVMEKILKPLPLWKLHM